MAVVLNVPPVCKAPDCKEGASILSKQGDVVRYMLTCRRHWYGQIKEKKHLISRINQINVVEARKIIFFPIILDQTSQVWINFLVK